MSLGRLSPAVFALTLLVAQGSCTDQAPVSTGEATLSVGINLAGTMVQTVVLDVSGPGIPTTLVFNIPIVNGSASGTITVPAGSNRTITLRGYDIGGVETHTGSLTVTIQPGTNAPMSVTLTPLTGDQPITATLGSFTVTVTQQPTGSLPVNGTKQLTAVVLTPGGQPAAGAVVTWATSNPGVAIVDGTGLTATVTATGAGSTTISAGYRGVAGSATITVTP